MRQESWLSLSDYAAKYKVSVSTLRRRIKSNEVEFAFEGGKYLLPDETMITHQVPHRPSQLSVQQQERAEVAQVHQATSVRKDMDVEESQRTVGEESVLTTAQTLLTEIKQAYSQVLQEKEEQIMVLKDQLSDLRTLIKVLESDNARLSRLIQPGKKPLDV